MSRFFMVQCVVKRDICYENVCPSVFLSICLSHL